MDSCLPPLHDRNVICFSIINNAVVNILIWKYFFFSPIRVFFFSEKILKDENASLNCLGMFKGFDHLPDGIPLQ